MQPIPEFMPFYKGVDKFKDQVVLITGGDQGTHRGTIINNASVNAYKGNPKLMDYTATKGALVALTRSQAQNLMGKGIRVNAVAPGPIWTPLIPASFSAKEVKDFGKQAPMKRAGQPNEVAGAFTWLASKEASYVTGQVIHPNGGYIVNA